ncbi:NADH-quinone oxidoreductase subunit NuoF [Candidatus Desantisbacteria bacterium]|nr:NADH-quinone oxidoreductase subunit NuoF [Candidatus Desantisbacteria bacterium]
MQNARIIVGLGSCGIASGGKKVYEQLKLGIVSRGLDITLEETGCIGMCYNEVLVDVVLPAGRTTYKQVDDKMVDRILDEHVVAGNVIPEWIITQEDEICLSRQQRIVLRNCGKISPESIDEYIEYGGYKAIEKVVKEMSKDEVIDEITGSGLRGRGGAGFPTGVKWGFASKSHSDEKYFICNADEGGPGAFMDRSVLEGDPHSVIEGMLIGSYAISANHGYIYVRAEYPLAIERLKIAMQQARARGFIGHNIFGSDFSFELEIKEGAGAFVCGEETALIASIEGNRGMPRLRPPFPAISGLYGKPTNINNVETLANIPWIILNGAGEYASFGTEKSKGTKVFALAGKIRRGGLVEVPMGMSLREVIFDIGGGIAGSTGKHEFKAAQLGGPSGGCIPSSLLDTPVDYDSINQTGAIMGSGGMVVMDDTTCMVDIARFFLNFTQNESCGKCTFCRIGTRRMLEILERIVSGNGAQGDIELLEELAQNIRKTSLCGLGQTAPNPVLTTLKYFRDEYESHIKERRCPAKACKELISFAIIDERCKGCGMCVKVCPAKAICGEKKKLHVLDVAKCIRCGQCVAKCKLEAIIKVDRW